MVVLPLHSLQIWWGCLLLPLWTRVKRLENLNIIEGYTANINPKAIGINELFFIEITAERHDDDILQQFSEALAEMPEVVEAHLVTGDYDYPGKNSGKKC